MISTWVAYISLIATTLGLAMWLELDLYHRRRRLWPTGPMPATERSFLTNPGRFLIYLGVAHSLVVGLWSPEIREPWINLFQAGFVGAVSLSDHSMSSTIWFHCFGFTLILLGYLGSRYRLDTGRPPPTAFGVVLAVLGVFGSLAKPSSGFWLVLINAIWVIALNRQWWKGQTASSPTVPSDKRN